MRKLLSIISITVLFTFMSCNNDDNLLASTTQNSIDVYVAGQKEANATYWKNNSEITLNNGGLNNTIASKIIYQNDNVYVFGRDNSFQLFDNNFLFWKNGNLTNLNDEFQEADYEVEFITDMLIVGDDEYFLGYLKNISNPSTYDLVYWVNGVKTVILENCIFRHQQSSIKIVNDDIYIFSKNDNNKLGVFINNSFNPIDSGYLAYDMITNESEIFTYGSIIGSVDVTGFYKNIITGSEISSPVSIIGLTFDSSDIYTIVNYDNVSWRREIKKNNDSYYISPEGFESHIVDLKVVDGNVYTIVRELISANYGPNKLLINNEAELVLDEGPSNFLNSIYVVEN
ncbi:hypothetical protein [Lacinutrix venerupis]|uniref:Uncharacterized protein n=1 Tax=Lacinutrix venerupis TaxID=1486034 RepID=A0AAC9LNG3_9FLAO|nr:hypothetical protein [Lacinutrix venerupis]APY00813.1 hypothetical protein BWR22_10980 [Lacinutrix venerupis]